VVDLWIADQLPAIIADGALHVAIRRTQRVANLGLLALQDPGQAATVDIARRFNACQATDSRQHVEQVNERVRVAGLDAGAAKHQWHTHRMFVQALLAKEPMAADGQSVVRQKDNQCLFTQLVAVERGQEPADMKIEPRDHGIVLAQLPAHLLGRARPGGQPLVAYGHLTVVERVNRQVVLRQGNRGFLV